MENLFLIYCILFIVRILLSPLIKVRSDILACGLFGYNGSVPPDMNAIKILGFANDSRGKDSCGYYYNNVLQHGVGTTNTFYKFMQGNFISDENAKHYNFIGHTRYLTTGSATIENAHPFNINDKWIIAHNGTIENVWDLCNKYKIDTTDVHVDSKALGLLIDKIGFDILEEYRGYAALLMMNLSDPDSLYVYHGESKKWVNGSPDEERPLWLMETENGVYLSSLKEPLMCIRTADWQVPKVLNHNFVFKVTNGLIDEDNAYWVNRIEANVGINFQSATQKTTTTIPVIQSVIPISTHTKVTTEITMESDGLDIFKETIPMSAFEPPFKNRILYYRNNYWIRDTNGEMKVASGAIYLDSNGGIHQDRGKGIHPHWFVNGILMESEAAYTQFLLQEDAQIGADGSLNYAFYISKYAKYAVTNKPSESSETYSTVRNRFFCKGKKATTSIKPLFSDRTYVYKDGILTSVSSSVKETIFLNSWKSYDDNKVTFKDVSVSDRKVLDKLWSYMTTSWLTVQEFYDNVPPEVIEAIKFYVKDVSLDDLIKIKNDDEYIQKYEELVSSFIDGMVESKFTIAESMSDGNCQPNEYLRDAYLEYKETDTQWEEIISDNKLRAKVNSFLKEEAPKLRELAESLQEFDNIGHKTNAKQILTLLDECENVPEDGDIAGLVKRIEHLRKSNL